MLLKILPGTFHILCQFLSSQLYWKAELRFPQVMEDTIYTTWCEVRKWDRCLGRAGLLTLEIVSLKISEVIVHYWGRPNQSLFLLSYYNAHTSLLEWLPFGLTTHPIKWGSSIHHFEQYLCIFLQPQESSQVLDNFHINSKFVCKLRKSCSSIHLIKLIYMDGITVPTFIPADI